MPMKILFTLVFLVTVTRAHAFKVNAGTYRLCSPVMLVKGKPMIKFNLKKLSEKTVVLKGAIADDVASKKIVGPQAVVLYLEKDADLGNRVEAVLRDIRSCRKNEKPQLTAGKNFYPVNNL